MKNWQKTLHRLFGYAPIVGMIIFAVILGYKYLPKNEKKDVLSATSFVGDDSKEKEVVVSQECSIYVDVGGAVAKPGVYCLRSDERLVAAIRKAGGFIESAYASKYVSRYLNLALPLQEDQKIYIPYQNELSCSVIPFALEASDEKEVLQKINEGKEKSDLEKKTEEEDTCISINSASRESLMSISGVGESMAQKIIDGIPYKVLEDLKNVSGVGDATYEKFFPSICL